MNVHPFITENDVIWIVAPHADDEILAAGGLLSIASQAGARIFILYVTVSGFEVIRGGCNSVLDSRMQEVRAVTDTLSIVGYDILFKGAEKHLKLDTVPLATLIGWMETQSTCSLCDVKPTIILLPSVKHNHQDHRAVYEAGMSVTRSNPDIERDKLCVMAYEIPGTGQLGGAGFEATVYLELNEDMIQAKCRLFEQYASQVAKKPGLRSIHAIRTLAQYRGLECGCEYAEAYELLKLKFKHSGVDGYVK